MKKHMMASLAMLAMLAACNDEYNDKFDIQNDILDVKNITMTLEQSDYATIAGNATNRELALAKDPEGKTGVAALELIGKKGYFTADAPADEYLPAFLSDKYPNADLKSKFTVTYNQYQAPSAYLNDFASVKGYAFDKSDYQTVWGDRVEALFLSPSTLTKIPVILGDKMKGAAEGDMVAVEYAYSETEPSIGGGAESMVYKEVTSVDTEGGNYVFLAPDKDDKLIPFGKLKEADETKGYGYMVGEPLEVADGFITADPSGYVITLTPAEKGYTMQRVSDEKFIYMKGTFNSFNLAASIPDGANPNWVVNSVSGGMASIVNLDNGKTVKLNFYEKGNSYSFGAYPGSSFGVFFNESCLGGSDGGFKVQDVNLSEGLSRIWKIDSGYGWKASAHVGDSDLAGESWIVSGEIDLTKAEKPVFTTEMALNFLKGNNRADFINLKISDDYTDNVTTATWKDLTVPTWPAGNNWSYVPSGDVDLADYAGKKVRIAFVYTSTSQCAPTFEVKNMKITGEASGYYADVRIFKEMPASEAEVPATARMATRASSVMANAAALYRHVNNEWKLYENNDAHVAVVEPDVYASIGAGSIKEPELTLPLYLNEKYPYALDDERAAVVYKEDEDKLVVAEFVKKAGLWMLTPDHTEQQIVLNKDADGITAKISVFIDESLLGNDGGFTAQDVVLTGGISYVWTNTAAYGWKGAAFANGQCNAAESWLVSPEFDFRKAKEPVFTYDEAVNKLGNGATVADHCRVMISTDYKNDVSTATWTELEIPTRPAGTDWNFINVGTIDLSKYVGNRVRVAYKYVSTDASAPTWEFKNILIKEKDAE